MGTAEYDIQQLVITSHIITYGNAADAAITEMIRDEIETMWNEPQAVLVIEGYELMIRFKITAEYQPGISPVDIYQNLDPRNNYFRIEEFAHGNISFPGGGIRLRQYFLRGRARQQHRLFQTGKFIQRLHHGSA